MPLPHSGVPPEQVLKSGSHPGPLEELAFWRSKANNLNSIQEQLQARRPHAARTPPHPPAPTRTQPQPWLCSRRRRRHRRRRRRRRRRRSQPGETPRA